MRDMRPRSARGSFPAVWLLRVIAFLIALLATGCVPPPASTPAIRDTSAAPTPASTATLAPTSANATVSPTSTTAPTTPSADLTRGWSNFDTADFTIGLPSDWTSLALSEEDAQAVFQRFERNNPALAKVLGSAEALQGVALWAFAPATSADFVDNLNIRRTPLDGQKIARVSDLSEAVQTQYEEFGFEIVESDAGRTIGGVPALYLRYNYEIATDAESMGLKGVQYLIAAETDLWILSFSAGPGSGANAVAAFDAIAGTFHVKQ